MLLINEKLYPNDFILQAVETLLDAGYQPEDFDDQATVKLAVDTEKGLLVVSTDNNEYRPIYLDLRADSEQRAILHTDPTDDASLLIAVLEIPDQAADVIDAPGMVPGCPRLYLYEKFDDDNVSHCVYMDGDGLQIRAK